MKKNILFSLSLLLISTFSYSQNFTKTIINNNTGADPFSLASGFIDGDAYLDIVVGTDTGNTVEWYKNNGDATFGTANILTAVAPNNLINVEGVAIGDLNGDGFNDIIATGYGSDNVVWFENNGDNTFQDAVLISGGLDGAGTVMVVNLDNDINGNLDIVVALNAPDTDTDSVIYMLGNGDGTFGGIQYIAPQNAASGPGTFDIADFDGDGDLDVVVGFTGNGDIYVYENRVVPDGTISFNRYTNPVNTGNGYLITVKFGDLNDDGNLDIIKADYAPSAGRKGVEWYTNNTSGPSTTFSANPVTSTIAKPSIGAAADLNNDGFNDLIIFNGRVTNKDIIWFTSNASGGLETTENLIDDTQQSIFNAEIKDFDNDGDLDIVTVSYFQNDLNIFINDLIVLSLDENISNSISIYPNPTKDMLHFKGTFTEPVKVSITDVVGKVILNTTVDNETSIDVSTLNNGLYIIKFEGTNSTYKFIKQ